MCERENKLNPDDISHGIKHLNVAIYSILKCIKLVVARLQIRYIFSNKMHCSIEFKVCSRTTHIFHSIALPQTDIHTDTYKYIYM